MKGLEYSCYLECFTNYLWLWLHTIHSVFEYNSTHKYSCFVFSVLLCMKIEEANSEVLIPDGAVFHISGSAYWSNELKIKMCCYIQVTYYFCSPFSCPVNILNSVSSMSVLAHLNFTYIIVFDFLCFNCGDLQFTEKGWPLLSNKVGPEHCIRTEQITGWFEPRGLHCGRDQLQSICIYRFQPAGGSLRSVLWAHVQASYYPNKFFIN